mmetsp:Transcript_41383/g.54408  ORF Transcript_41383/g.54408 Transcript_41383/m.54408 type:complete len:161 (+) Transcript_41383:34-516(+)
MDFSRKVDPGNSGRPYCPALVLSKHVAFKGLQLGSLVGLFAVTPALKLYQKKPFINIWTKVMPISPFVGTALSLGMLYAKYQRGELNMEGIDDRAYRLNKNIGQNTVDKYSIFGTMLGATAATFLLTPTFATICAASSTGLSLAVVLHVTIQLKPEGKVR